MVALVVMLNVVFCSHMKGLAMIFGARGERHPHQASLRNGIGSLIYAIRQVMAPPSY